MKRLTALVFAMFFVSGCGSQPESQTPANGPRITFNQEEFDFGPVAEGIELKHVFKITNTGTEPLLITKAASNCGCTIPKLPKSILNPGESTQLTVELDTSMKQGEVTKTVDVDSDDPDRPKVILAMYMDVENRHKSLSERSKAKFLTEEKCINCHVAQGVGLFGEDLYKADCGMCHGEDAKGKVGPCLIRDYTDPAVRNYVLDVTAHGSKRHASMPGFLEDSGGPLAKVQIDSIVDYLATLRDKK
jgi:mono/diheme cytochrome c family protein